MDSTLYPIPFRFWCQKVLPLVYDDSLSYYELLCKVVDYLNNTISDVSTLTAEFNTLKEYVDAHLSDANIDALIDGQIQKYIDNGTFDKLINQGLMSKKLDNVTIQMETDANLTTLLDNPVCVATSDGKVIGCGISVNDLMPKPRMYTKNALAIYDDHGNLTPCGMDDETFLNSQNLVVERPTTPPECFRLMNGIQIQWGKTTVENLEITTPIGNMFENSVTTFPAIGFYHSFSDVPAVSLTLHGGNNVILGRVLHNQNAIINARIYSLTSETSTIDIYWQAVGHWEA